MTLTDSGPLIALQDRNDAYHARCLSAFPNLPKPLLTTLPAITEAMHFLGREMGWRGQERLWRILRAGELRVAPLDEDILNRMADLMERYNDTPMDFADSSLVAVAEAQDIRRIFTLNSHFQGYRLKGSRKLEVVPKI